MTFKREWFTTNPLFHKRCTWEMTPFWYPLAKGTSVMQVGGRILLTTSIQVLHVLRMKNNFISISKLISKGLKVEFDKDGCKVNNVHGTIMAEA
jgi:hypothetical protein